MPLTVLASLMHLAGPDLVILLMIVPLSVFWLWAIVDCLVHETSADNSKLIWSLVVLFVPLGSFLYLGHKWIGGKNRDSRGTANLSYRHPATAAASAPDDAQRPTAATTDNSNALPLVMYQLHYGGENHGPYMLDQIRSMWSLGIITADALYWHEARFAWEPVADLLKPPAPPSPPARPAVAPRTDGAVTDAQIADWLRTAGANEAAAKSPGPAAPPPPLPSGTDRAGEDRRSRKKYALTRGMCAFGIPLVVGGLVIHVLFIGGNIWSLLGSAVVMIPGCLWYGYRRGGRQWDDLQKKARANASASNAARHSEIRGDHRQPPPMPVQPAAVPSAAVASAPVQPTAAWPASVPHATVRPPGVPSVPVQSAPVQSAPVQSAPVQRAPGQPASVPYASVRRASKETDSHKTQNVIALVVVLAIVVGVVLITINALSENQPKSAARSATNAPPAPAPAAPASDRARPAWAPAEPPNALHADVARAVNETKMALDEKKRRDAEREQLEQQKAREAAEVQRIHAKEEAAAKRNAAGQAAEAKGTPTLKEVYAKDKEAAYLRWKAAREASMREGAEHLRPDQIAAWNKAVSEWNKLTPAQRDARFRQEYEQTPEAAILNSH